MRCPIRLFIFFLSVCIAPFAIAQISYSGGQIVATNTNAQTSVNVFGTSTVDQMRFLIVDSFPGDVFPAGATLIPVVPSTTGTRSATFAFDIGPQPGIRRLRFCTENSGGAACNPATSSNEIQFGAVNFSNCTINASATTVNVNEPISVVAPCNLVLGPDMTLGTTNFNWNPPGATPASQSNIISFATPGLQTITTRPAIGIRLPSTTLSGAINGIFFAPLVSISIQVGAAPPLPQVTVQTESGQTVLLRDRLTGLTAAVSGPAADVESVQFFELRGVERLLIGTATQAPYRSNWVPQTTGTVGILAAAKIRGIATAIESASIRLQIEPPPNPGPDVSVTQPAAGERFERSESVAVRANASDPDGVARVQFFYARAGGVALQFGDDDNQAPFEMRLPSGLAGGEYDLFARAFDGRQEPNESSIVRITIGTLISIVDLSIAAQREFVPGGAISLTVQAQETALGQATPARNRALIWRTMENNMGGAQTGCQPADSASSGTVSTDNNGIASITFRAGCTSGNKRITVATLENPTEIKATILLSGPDQSVTNITPDSATGGVYYVMPGTSQQVSVSLTGSSIAALQGGNVVWSLTSGSATLVPGISTISNGIASTSVMLAPGAAAATLSACVQGRTVCAVIQLLSLQAEVEQGATTIAEPITTAALEAPRVQIGLIGNRMQQLRNTSGHGFSNSVSVSAGGGSVSVGGGKREDEQSAGEDDEDDAEQQEASKVGVFLMGDISVNERTNPGQGGNFEVNTRGLTLGTDYRFSQAFTAGIALGGLRGSADLGSTQQDNRGYSASVFAQYLPSDRWYFSGVLNRGRNSYDIERLSTRAGQSNLKLVSSGSSNQSALMVESGYSFAAGQSKFTPFVRYEAIRAAIGDLTETGGPSALAIDGYDAKLAILSGGLQADWVINSDSGVFIPGVRVEFTRESADSDPLRARLAGSVSGFLPVAAQEKVDDAYGNAGLSLQWITGVKGRPISFNFGFDYLFGRDGFAGKSLSIGGRIPF
jgi:uncharacterized protein YhjY with autotransporter beta-barrel domain